MDRTKIEWTDATWNPLRGCSRVSKGCENCYAEGVAHRFGQKSGSPYEGLTVLGKNGPRWTGEVRLVPEVLDQPLRWQRPRLVFVNSMSDLFHKNAPFEYIAAVFGVMAACPRHTFQVLTKRPARALEFFEWLTQEACLRDVPIGREWNEADVCLDEVGYIALESEKSLAALAEPTRARTPWPLPNVWLGVSTENQATADERIPLLLKCPAAVRWLSCEPLLGPVDLTSALSVVDANGEPSGPRCNPDGSSALGWVVAGGESGPKARPMHPDWARYLRFQCEATGTPFFFKQWGEWAITGHDPVTTPGTAGDLVVGERVANAIHPDGTSTLMRRVGKGKAGRLLDGRTWDEYPEVSHG